MTDDLVFRPPLGTSDTTELRVDAYVAPNGEIVWTTDAQSENGAHLEYRGPSRAEAIRRAAELAIAWGVPITAPALAHHMPAEPHPASAGNVMPLPKRHRRGKHHEF